MFKSIITTTLFLSSMALADHGPCHADREKFCKDVPHEGGAMMKCMKENEANLSAECKAHAEMMKAEMKEVKEACHADVEKFCADVKKGRGAIMKCLKKNKDQVSEACKAEWKDMKAKRKAHKH